jgi:glutathione S-transferase
MARYCGKLAGLYPSDPLEGLIVDEAMDSINELMSKCPQDKDAELKKKNRQEFQAGFMTTCAKFLESRIQKYGGGKGFVSSPSVADFVLMGVVQSVKSGSFDYVDTTFFDAYPGIL